MKLQIFRGKIKVYSRDAPRGVYEAKGDYYVRLKARNGKILMHSEGYKRKAKAKNLAISLSARTLLGAKQGFKPRIPIEDLTGK